MTGGHHAVRGLSRELLRSLALTTALSVAPVLGGLIMLVPSAFAIPCTGAVDTANSTTCANGVDGAGLVYVADNPLYVGGDFTLRLDNHDVDTFFGNAIGFTGVTAGNDGTITLENGSDIESGPGSAGISSFAVGSSTTINIRTGSSVKGVIAILAQSNGGDITLNTDADTVVTGALGMTAAVAGAGNILVDAQGTVTAFGAAGRGIEALAELGTVEVKTGSGAIAGGLAGIIAQASANTVKVTTGTGVVSGTNEAGIIAIGNTGTTVATGGDVSGATNGITAQSIGPGNILVETAAGTQIRGGGAAGIAATALGTSLITITNNADARGLFAGIQATSGTGAIQIDNTGVVANLSGNTFDLAIQTVGGATTVDNDNLLIGRVSLSDLGDTINNTGLWKTGGTSSFGAGFDVVNNSGTLLAAHDPLANESTMFGTFQTLNNSGLVSLVDGKEGDDFFITGEGGSQYVGQGGRLAVDAFLAEGGAADTFSVGGNTSGVTHLVVNLTNPVGSTPNFEGITVVQVLGNTAQGDFDLEGGVLNAGFFAWNVKVDGNQQKLFTTGLGAGAFEFAAGITGAQDIWHQTTGTLLQRQADLRALLAGTQVTPVADFTEPIESTPIGRVTPGLWFKGVGAYLERDADEDNNVVTDRKQEIYGFLGGFDFGTESEGEAWLFGLFGGYIFSDLDFDQTGTEWNYEGPSVGAYATYLNDAFYADVTVKADFLDVDIDASDIAPGDGEADTDVLNIGGQIDAGYKVGLERGLFVEPQASLAVVHTEVDDIDDIFGGAVDFDDETSVRGRLGLRLGHELTASNQIIYSSDVTASVWQEFAGDNDVTIFAPLTPATDVSDSPSETFGDVSLGFSVISPDGWSSFLRANYQFSDDYDAFAGNAGVRYAW